MISIQKSVSSKANTRDIVSQRACGWQASRTWKKQALLGPSKATREECMPLDTALTEYKQAPPSVKYEITADVKNALETLTQQGTLTKFRGEELPTRRLISIGELRLIGVKDPEAIAIVSVRNDAAFLMTVVGTTSVLAVLVGQLPGDWGFFGSYLTGGISIAVLAIGSTNPGILQFAIDSFSKVFPDYKGRVVKHEAAHFLTAHVLGVPVAGYSLMLGKEHTDLAEAALQQRLIEKQLSDEEVDRLSVVAIAGAVSEAMNYPDVQGQNADLMDLQRIMLRSTSKMSNQQQQNQTRWAAYQAAAILKKYRKEYDALVACMEQGGSVLDCVLAIENAST